MNEKQLQGLILSRWRQMGLPGTLVFAIPNANAFGQSGLTRGAFDLCVLAPGLPVGFLELKTEKGRVSEHQQAFKSACDEAGAPAAIAYGLDEAVAVLERWGVIRRAAA